MSKNIKINRKQSFLTNLGVENKSIVMRRDFFTEFGFG